VSEGKQKITDGLKTCWFGGRTDAEGLPNGEGPLKTKQNKTQKLTSAISDEL
jgi:hypothetical protein